MARFKVDPNLGVMGLGFYDYPRWIAKCEKAAGVNADIAIKETIRQAPILRDFK
jgi:hypothetical protein